ncbi:hypothetical protein BOTNAR_0662g00030 [Botryotinia narcissicola]|uniref:Uncharacterized protein n=1 Tax=Botryotinia narcissicola TaxID=278944 RepID=A0A4Z1H9L5_9HELO|nr:hypothetical protein BOTNAR_0662g00030 [Botryotinia narcissicola]
MLASHAMPTNRPQLQRKRQHALKPITPHPPKKKKKNQHKRKREKNANPYVNAESKLKPNNDK